MSLMTKIVHRIYDKPNIDIDIMLSHRVLLSLGDNTKFPALCPSSVQNL